MLSLLLVLSVLTATAHPKYASHVRLLSQENSYLRKAQNTDFWTLIPYYVSQRNESSCGLAVATMLANAYRPANKLSSKDVLFTQDQILTALNSQQWSDAFAPNGAGLSLEQMKAFLQDTFKSLALGDVELQLIRVASENQLESIKKDLEENERSAQNFIIANYKQGIFTGDPEGNVGHHSLVGAYDKKNRRVLILDVDRSWYEPYWVPLSVFIKGLATKDSETGQERGYLKVQKLLTKKPSP